MNNDPKPNRPQTKPPVLAKHIENPERWIIAIIAIVVLGAMIYDVIALPDWPHPIEKIGNLIHDVPPNADRMELHLEDHTLAQKPGNIVPILSLPANSP